jgi:hypothetical protein
MCRKERTVEADPPIGVAVAEAVAAADATDALALPPLADTIDPEALDDFVDGPTGYDTTVEFEYQGHRITVHGDGILDVSPGERAAGRADASDGRAQTDEPDRTDDAEGPSDQTFAPGDDSSVDLDD